MFAKKSLGQNFLQSGVKLQKIADAISSDIELIIEIGPGHGELTQYLLKKNIPLLLIEKDRDLIPQLKEKFPGVNIIEGDVLKQITNEQLSITLETSYAVVGNIPYYITGKLLRIIGELPHRPREVIFLMQKEVAMRICAEKGEMNLFAASVQWWAKPKIITTVPRTSFIPQPNVDSAVLYLKTQKTSRENEESYYTFIKTLFKQPRKTLKNNLSHLYMPDVRKNIDGILQKAGFSPELRPQQLSFEEVGKLFKLLSE